MRQEVLQARKEFAARVAERDRTGRGPGHYGKNTTWDRPDPQHFHNYWLERFTLEEITQMAGALDTLTNIGQDTSAQQAAILA